jgi:ribonucleoside-diphosphate reductase alpha chain
MTIKTRKVDLELTDNDGKIIFERKQFEIPEFWSDRAALIAASKYATDKENSVLDIIDRVVNQITEWGKEQGYFSNKIPTVLTRDGIGRAIDGTPVTFNEKEIKHFSKALKDILVNQRAAFNTPVWLNVGVKENLPQSSACFLGSVEDDLEDILLHTFRAGKVFRSGSGIGINVSNLRHKGAELSNKGRSSGPISFMRMWDKASGVVRSGGKSRRSAVLIRMNADHPDIEEFINCKKEEEDKAKALIRAGYSFEEAYRTVDFQNANHSVGVTDEFMEKAIVAGTKENKLLDKIAKMAWETGDPGLQFHDTINRFNPLPLISNIETSNPCQPGWATVLTPEGIKTFDDINIGSTIWSGKKWTKVVNKVATGIKPVNEYITTAGTFVGTKNHKVFQNKSRVEVDKASSIDICWGPITEDIPVDLQDVVDGWVLGDGSVHKASNNLVYLNLGQDDIKPFHENCLEYIIKYRPGLNKNAWEVQTSILHSELPKTFDRKVPNRFKYGSLHKVRGFLKGLYAANGSVCGNRVTLKATSFNVIKDVQEMLSSLGIGSYFTTNSAKEVKFKNGTYLCKKSYDLNISGHRKRFEKLIGFYHEGKKNKLQIILEKELGNQPKTNYEIKKVNALGNFPVYDITVDAEEHSYWTGGLLVSNCGEIYGIPWTACNLCALNILKYYRNNNNEDYIDYVLMEKDINILVTAMDILIDNSYYPNKEFEQVAKETRPLGLGMTNLGALLIESKVPYGTKAARLYAKNIMENILNLAIKTSCQLANKLGSFPLFIKDNSCIQVYENLTNDSGHSDYTRRLIEKYGIRNSQLTTAMPAGTVSFFMDCDTTGIEPLFARKMVKQLEGGGTIEIFPKCIDNAAKSLKQQYNYYDKENVSNEEVIQDFISGEEPIFATANEISWVDHVYMTAALQSVISGGVSKTINMPSNATVEDVKKAYILSWKQGLKGITIYRDGSKGMQPLTDSSKTPVEEVEELIAASTLPKSFRIKLPDDRESKTHAFNIAGHKGYITVGLYDNGAPGEVFIRMQKQGSMTNGMMDNLAKMISLALQYGVPLSHIVDKLKGDRFEPAGITTNEDIRIALSVSDYIGRYLELNFMNTFEDEEDEEDYDEIEKAIIDENSVTGEATGNFCMDCGGELVQNGSCYVCSVCATTTGCS